MVQFFGKWMLIASALFGLAASVGGQTPSTPERTEPGERRAAEPIKDVYPLLTVVGEWRVTHPDWTDVLTLREDGSMVTTRQGTTGRWILTGDGGTPVIVFRWDRFGTESVAMVSTNHFRGMKRNGRFIDMRRVDDHDAKAKE